MSSPGGKRSPAVDGGIWVPEEITTEILWRLPTAASLARFRCVNKSWRSHLSEHIPKILFSDDEAARRITIARCSDPESWRRLLSEFVGKALVLNDEAARVMIARNKGKNSTTSYSIRGNNDTLPHVSSGTLPGEFSVIAGCSRGIFCIGGSIHNKIILWNPTTSEAKVLPSLAPLYRSRLHGRLGDLVGPIGFGFDQVTNDYKVLIRFSTLKDPDLIYSYPSGANERLFLYSLRENSYKRLHDVPVELFRGQKVREYPLAATSRKNERCYWLWRATTGEYYHYYEFTCFDMSTEAFTTLQVPVPERRFRSLSWHDAKDSLHMAKDGSCLVAVYPKTVYGIDGSSFLEVWAELDYVALGRPHECSWIRLYNVESNIPVASCGYFGLHVPGLWKDGKLFAWHTVMSNDGELRVMDLENGNWAVLDPIETKLGRQDYLELVTYLPSTMSLSRFAKRKRCRLIC